MDSVLYKTRETEADLIYNKAIVAYDKKKYNEAITIFSCLLSEYSEYVTPWNINFWIGLCHLKRENYKSAIDHLSMAYKEVDCKISGESCFEIARNLADAYLFACMYPESLRFYDEAEKFINFYIGKEWGTVRYLYHLEKGRAYLNLSQCENAIAEYEKARQEIEHFVDATPADTAILDFEVSRALINSERAKQALKILETIPTSDIPPKKIDQFYMTFADAFFQLAKYRAALDNLEKINLGEIQSGYLGKFYFMKGLSLYHQQEFQRAKENLQLASQFINEDDKRAESIKKYMTELISKT